jgi:hypothetical protein
LQKNFILKTIITLPLPEVIETVAFDIFSEIESIIAKTHFAWSRVLHSFTKLAITGLSLKLAFKAFNSFSASVK